MKARQAFVEMRDVADAPELHSTKGRLVATGVAIAYGSLSSPIPYRSLSADVEPERHGQPGSFLEQITSGAYSAGLQSGDVRALDEHNPDRVLARSAQGSLRLVDTASELRYEIDLPDNIVGRLVARRIEDRQIKGASLGFLVQERTWGPAPSGGSELRSIRALALGHLALTRVPLYRSTTVALNGTSLARHPPAHRRPTHWFI